MAEWEDIPEDEWQDMGGSSPVQTLPQGPVDHLAQGDFESPLSDIPGILSNQVQNFAEGATLGYRDEAEALTSGAWDDRPYTVRLADIENRRKRENLGNEYETLAKLSGGLGTGALTGAALNPSTLLGTAAVVGGEGAIAGLGMSQGSFFGDPAQSKQAIEDTGIGALFGLGVGALGGSVANIAHRAMRPMGQRVSAWIKGNGEQVRKTTHQRNLATAKEFDIPTTAPERLGDDALMAKQARYQSDEILNKSVSPTLNSRQNRLNQIAREEIGLGPADDINRTDLGIASKDIKAKFNKVSKEFEPININEGLTSKLDEIATGDPMLATKPPDRVADMVDDLREVFYRSKNGLTGEAYMRNRSNYSKKIQAEYKKAEPDIEMAEAYGDVIELLDGEFAKQLSGESKGLWKTARTQWKNLRLLDRPNAVIDGNVNLNKVKTGLNRNKGFTRGMDQSPLSRLADLNDSTKFQFGRSGTSERSPFNMMQKIQSTVELPFANAVISRGGLLGPSIPGGPSGAFASGTVPPILETLEGME